MGEPFKSNSLNPLSEHFSSRRVKLASRRLKFDAKRGRE